ncbi:MAG: hypothetical protein PUG74_10785, partial [Prevotellaceae bacterium]|nr:hypothetical protein [Prevotellaceae bacterium]
REVKPACADGTAMQCGRVGRRPLYSRELSGDVRGVLSFFDWAIRLIGLIGQIGANWRKCGFREWVIQYNYVLFVFNICNWQTELDKLRLFLLLPL